MNLGRSMGSASDPEARSASLYTYYQTRTILPTFANFREEADLVRYAGLRNRLFAEKLNIPVRYFRDLSMLDFGPDSGEDALVFARNGALLTIVEPNARAHPALEEYFERFGLTGRLEALIESDVESYQGERRYDFIDAEGFIYTVQPISRWLSSFNRLLQIDGLFVITHYDSLGGFVELSLKALYHAFRRASGRAAEDAARHLYTKKWDSIPHTRSFESWVMDVLDNPFVRRRYFLDAADLCRQALAHGFEVYSSWPHYRDVLDTYWHKRILDREDALRRGELHIARSSLSFLTGYKAYLTSTDPTVVFAQSRRVEGIVDDVNSLIDVTDDAILAKVDSELGEVAGTLSGDQILFDSEADRSRAAGLVEALRRAFVFVAQKDYDGLAAFTSANEAFIAGWGLPTHVAVFKKFADAS
jgi:hypothetical protein